MKYIDRDLGTGKIVTSYDRKQYEDQERIQETHADCIAFMAPKVFSAEERIINIFSDKSEAMTVLLKALLHLKNEIQDLKSLPHITQQEFLKWFEDQLD